MVGRAAVPRELRLHLSLPGQGSAPGPVGRSWLRCPGALLLRELTELASVLGAGAGGAWSPAATAVGPALLGQLRSGQPSTLCLARPEL